MARQRVKPKERRIEKQHNRADTHMTPGAIGIAEGNDRVVGQEHVKDQTGVEEVAVTVVQNQWKTGFTCVLCVWFRDSTRWR